MRESIGPLDGTGLHVSLVVAQFNEGITSGLADGAVAELKALGVADDHLHLVRVPGALELPLAADLLARAGGTDAILVLGAVIQGDTDHYDFVCAETTRGCGRVALDHGLPVLFGVLTCQTLAQASSRSASGPGNKGAECARAAVSMARLAQQLNSSAPDATTSDTAS